MLNYLHRNSEIIAILIKQIKYIISYVYYTDICIYNYTDIYKIILILT